VTPPGIPHAVRIPAGKGKPLQLALSIIPPDKRASWRLQNVQLGDTFETVARRTGVSEATLAAVNGGELKVGQKLIIPTSNTLRNVAATAPKGTMGAGATNEAKIIVYKVRAGEGLGDIAARYEVSIRDIAALNRINTSSKLRAGQTIKVPLRRGR
jgi:membrane-bound lytic murein transglycosylase D